MWLVTKYGFFSSVNDGKQSDLQQIRARCASHLECLQKAYPPIAQYPILTDAGTDYEARIKIPKEMWMSLSRFLSEDATTYHNFKDAAFYSGITKGYNYFLHEVWHLGVQLLSSVRNRYSATK